jgi:hypothetical protein
VAVTIRKGEPWGSVVVPGPGMQMVRSDAELRTLVIEGRASGRPLPVVGLLGGDLMRTLGGTGDPERMRGSEPVPHLPIDVVRLATDDDRETVFVAHLVARRSWWRGPITAAMNAEFHGRWDVAPRSHPNDGRIDLVTVSPELGPQQRWLARPRLLLGTHVPHPLITIRQHDRARVDLGSRRRLWVDGQRWGSARIVELTVEPDALIVCV